MKIISSFGLGTEVRDNEKKFNAILGISVGSRDFSKEKIKEYIKFCINKFDKTLIIIVDQIKMYNWMAFDNMQEFEALNRALFEGEEMLTAVKKVVKNLKQENFDVSRIKIVNWTDLKNSINEYEKVLSIIEKEYKTNSEFKEDALDMTARYAYSKKLFNITDKQKEIAVNFLLQELTVFLLIGKHTKEKYCIDVYPGTFEVMEKILDEKYNNLLSKLPSGIVYGQIEIKV